MSDLVKSERRGHVLVLRVDNPPVNALSQRVADALLDEVAAAERDRDVLAIVVAGAGRTFGAGVDIVELEEAAWGRRAKFPNLHDLLEQVETCSKPVVMAIHGAALGGGLELAMAGHYRLAAPDVQFGQPEVTLGLIPGAEGTQRLPRLVGVEHALTMCVTGKSVRARDGVAIGLVHALIPDDLIAGAVAFAQDLVTRGSAWTQTRDRRDRLGTAAANARLFVEARAMAGQLRPRQLAPLKAIDAIEAATSKSFADGCRVEQRLFSECGRSDEARALLHVFRAERMALKLSGDAPQTSAVPLRRVAIIGGGPSVVSLAMACADAGIAVLLRDESSDAISRAMQSVRSAYDASLAYGRQRRQTTEERIARIEGQTHNAGLEAMDVIIAADAEALADTQDLLRQLESSVRPDCLIVIQTSSLSIDAVASATTRAPRVVGLHWLADVSGARLFEIVRGRDTSSSALAIALRLMRILGARAVVVRDGPGFLADRLSSRYASETQFFTEEGATPEQVDRALTEFGVAVGPFAADDAAGLDISRRIRDRLSRLRDPAARKPRVQDRLVDMGRLGRKTRAGWYAYDERRNPAPDPDVIALIRSMAAAANIPQRRHSNQELVQRAVYALVNEGARALEAEIAHRASDIDIVAINGLGFPAWRGGPMLYADCLGLTPVLDQISLWHREFGDRWAPAPLLRRLASSGSTFREYDIGRNW